MRLGQVERWHAVYDREKVATLVEAYKAGEAVPTVVCLHQGKNGLLVALSGVHRLAALDEVYGDACEIDELPDGLISVYDAEILCEGEDEDTVEAISRAFPPRGDVQDVIRAVLPFVDDTDAVALRTQLV